MKKMFKINKDLRSANISRTVRFPEQMFEELNTVASKNDISFNLLVLQCCRYALDNLDSEEEELRPSAEPAKTINLLQKA